MKFCWALVSRSLIYLFPCRQQLCPSYYKKIPEFASKYNELIINDRGLFWEMIKMHGHIKRLRQLPMQNVKQMGNEIKKSVHSHDLISSKNSYLQTLIKPLNPKWRVWKVNLQKLFLLKCVEQWFEVKYNGTTWARKIVNNFQPRKAKPQIKTDKNSNERGWHFYFKCQTNPWEEASWSISFIRTLFCEKEEAFFQKHSWRIHVSQFAIPETPFPVSILFPRCKLCFRYRAENFNQNPIMGAIVKILRARDKQGSTRVIFGSNSSKG